MSADVTQALYEQWAPQYPPFSHNPLMRAEELAMLELWPRDPSYVLTPAAAQAKPRRRHALDLACGSGRYSRLLARTFDGEITALDFSTAMLRQVSGAHRVCASMMSLPFIDRAFALVVSGLAVGHAVSIEVWMAEIARVLADDGILLYSDFHPEAARAGLTRSFKDENRRTHTLPHHPYCVSTQRAAAESAGLQIEALKEIRVGVELQEAFPGSQAFYQLWQGLPLVLVVRARKKTHA